jgi:hypothetical protein
VKCPECVKAGLRSTVQVGYGTTTLLASRPYYDEDGVLHSHDPNRTSQTYGCSNGHEWGAFKMTTCLARGCDYGKGS